MSTTVDVLHANLQSCILYIYSTNIGTEYFKHGIYCPFFFLSSKCSLFHNSNVFGSCVIHILYTGCAKIKKNNSGAKRLKSQVSTDFNEMLKQFPPALYECHVQCSLVRSYVAPWPTGADLGTTGGSDLIPS